jgi:hypothetical protein
MLRIVTSARLLQMQKDIDFWRERSKEFEKIAEAMARQLPPPTCKVCGSADLYPDPSGYYWDAVRWDGAPLLCLGECRDKEMAKMTRARP